MGLSTMRAIACSLLALTALAGCVSGGTGSSGNSDLSPQTGIFAAAAPDGKGGGNTKEKGNNGGGAGSNNGRGNKSSPEGETTDPGTETGTETGSETGSETGTETGSETGSETGTETGSETGSETGTETGTETGSETEPQPVADTKTWYVAMQAINDMNQHSPDSNEAQGNAASGERVTLFWEAPSTTLDGECTTVESYLVKLGTESGSYSHSLSVSAYDHGLHCTATSTNQCGNIYACEMVVEIPSS